MVRLLLAQVKHAASDISQNPVPIMEDWPCMQLATTKKSKLCHLIPVSEAKSQLVAMEL